MSGPGAGKAVILGRVGAIAAALGGAAWVGKAGAILVTGNQPPLLFEVAPLLFAGALVGLRGLLGSRPGQLAVAGGWLAGVAAVLAAVDLAQPSGATYEADFSPLTFFAFLCVLVALVLLGLQIRQRPLFPPPSRLLPAMLGILSFPLVAIGGALETINERLLEVPIVLLGAARLWLGGAMWQAASRRAPAVDAGGPGDTTRAAASRP